MWRADGIMSAASHLMADADDKPPSHSDGDETPPTGSEVNDEELIHELGRVLWEREAAITVVGEARFPRESTPVFEVPWVFWAQVVEAARNGAIAGGLQSLATAAARKYPDNPIFAAYSGRVVARPTRQAAIDQQRRSYLEHLIRFDRARRPLAGILRDDDLLPVDLTMHAVEVPVLLVAERAWGTQERRRSLSVLLEERWKVGDPFALVILGDVGTGKSTLFEQTAAALARAAEQRPETPLPFLVAAEDVPALARAQSGRYHRLRPHDLLLADDSTKWIFLVDSYDELDAKTREIVDDALEDLRDDSRTGGLVIASRPAGRPNLCESKDCYRVAPWSIEDWEGFARRWSAIDTQGKIVGEQWDNPFTATLTMAYSRRGQEDATRTQLLGFVVETLFDKWMARRRHPAGVEWSTVAPILESLAKALLGTGKSSFAGPEILAILEREVPGEVNRIWIDARKELGLLRARPDGRYEFLSRPIAEYLAGAGLLSQSPEELAATATARWAEEPVRHCVGLHALRNGSAWAVEYLHALAQPHFYEQHAPHTLRMAGVAARSAGDLGDAATPAVDRIADALLVHLTDEMSNWRPAVAQDIIRAQLARSGPLSVVLRERTTKCLETLPGSERLTEPSAVRQELSIRGLWHRDPEVRLGAVHVLAPVVNEPWARLWLVRMLRDSGTLGMGRSVAVAAGLVLRDASRDDPFHERVLPYLRTLLCLEEQIGSAAAAVALRPDEAPAEDLVRALKEFSVFPIPQRVIQELMDTPDGIAALAASPLNESPRFPEPMPEHEIEMALRLRTRPSSFVRACVSRALGSAVILLDEMRRVACMAGACRGRASDLEILCELAVHDPIPLIQVFETVVDHHRPPPVAPNRPFLSFSSQCTKPLQKALERHPALLTSLLALWTRTRDDASPVLMYPGEALAEAVLRGNDEATSVYAAWLPTTINGAQEPPHVPDRLLLAPQVRETAHTLLAKLAERTFTGYIDDGKRRYWRLGGTAEFMNSLRSLWLDDQDICAHLEDAVRRNDRERALYAMMAMGPDVLPGLASECLLGFIEAKTDRNDVQGNIHQISALVFSASTTVSGRCVNRLCELARSDLPVRFAAGVAVLPRLPTEDERRYLSASLARSWPGDNWSFYYGRHQGILSPLVVAAPSDWAARCCEMDPGSALDFAGSLLNCLGVEQRNVVLQHLVRSARHNTLPWFWTLRRPRQGFLLERTFDSVLELVYESGFEAEAMCRWLGEEHTSTNE